MSLVNIGCGYGYREKFKGFLVSRRFNFWSLSVSGYVFIWNKYRLWVVSF